MVCPLYIFRVYVDVCIVFIQDRWCQERALTDLQWSPHRPELVLACYSARGHGLDATSSSSLHTDADGLVLMW